MSYSNREVELFQLWAKRTEIERNISSLKARLIDIQKKLRELRGLSILRARKKRGWKHDRRCKA